MAGSLAVVIALGGAIFGLQRLNSGSEVRIGVDPSALANSGIEAGSQLGATTPTGSAAAGAVSGPRTGAENDINLGVFLGTSQSKVEAFGDWLGRKPDYAIDVSSRATWDEISNPAYMIKHWQDSQYRMVYSVALLPTDGDYSMRAGANGEYDKYFRTLAQNLVDGGQQNAILRLGWEFNLKGWEWSTKNPDDFIAYWRHIVTAMRSVPGGDDLKFDWNLHTGNTPYDATKYYPGADYVDYVGVDVYDTSWAEGTYPYGSDCDATCRLDRQEAVWKQLYSGHHGLAFWSKFARSKGKPLSLPEWGLWQRPDGHGGNDNPYFINQMHAFIDDPHNNVTYHGYLQVDVADGEHKLTTLKNAGKVYKKLFGTP